VATAEPRDPRDDPRLLTNAEAARRLGIGTTTLHGLVRRGELRSVRIGRKTRRIPIEEVDAFMARLPREVGYDGPAVRRRPKGDPDAVRADVDEAPELGPGQQARLRSIAESVPTND
jgi:excisionase family DNA binding protein